MIHFLLLCCLAGVCLGLDVRQSPSHLITKPGAREQIFCNHDKTDYRMMLWYQQSPGDTAMKLIGYLYYKQVTMEQPYKYNFNISGDLGQNTAKNGSLTVNLEKQEHSAVYYCATRWGVQGSEAYFGGGTKLTVLEPDRNVTSPTVTVLRPPANECKKKTIVCVASGFYPDHVSVSWQIDGDNTSTGVATDNNAALQKDKYYSITSRLSVSDEVWFNPDSDFNCIVSFYNGTGTEYHRKQIHGDKAKSKVSVLTREKHLKITQAAKLSYIVFIFKSIVYGVFVTFLVWKLQKSTRKEN